MGRLIDADKLIELVKLQQQDALDGATITNKTIFKQKATDCKNFIELIKEMPTAFDLEAVVEKMDELPTKRTSKMVESKETPEWFYEVITGEYISKNDAIEIVKGGAV